MRGRAYRPSKGCSDESGMNQGEGKEEGRWNAAAGRAGRMMARIVSLDVEEGVS